MKQYEVRCNDCPYVAPFIYRNPDDAERTKKLHLLLNPDHDVRVIEI